MKLEAQVRKQHQIKILFEQTEDSYYSIYDDVEVSVIDVDADDVAVVDNVVTFDNVADVTLSDNDV
jgi:hypothetical protein